MGKEIKGDCTADGISFPQNSYTNKADKGTLTSFWVKWFEVLSSKEWEPFK